MPKSDRKKTYTESLEKFLITSLADLNIEKLRSAENPIHPALVIAERAFSLASNFTRKTRSRIASELLESLMILKYLC